MITARCLARQLSERLAPSTMRGLRRSLCRLNGIRWSGLGIIFVRTSLNLDDPLLGKERAPQLRREMTARF